MSARFLIVSLIVAAGGCSRDDAASGDAAADAAAAPGRGAYTTPLTPWGDPDLRGRWPLDHLNGTPVQRPTQYGTRRELTDEEFAEHSEQLARLNARYDNEISANRMGIGHWAEMGEPNRLTSLIAEPDNGRVPAMTPEGRRISATLRSSWSDIPFDSIADFNALDRCITRGLPASMFPFMYNSGVEVMQAPGYVIIRLEIVHETRVIPVDGRPPLGPGVRNWLGESRGYWDGATLVIETTNFNARSPMLIVGPGATPIPTSEQLRIVERLTRTGPDSIEYEIAVEDPVTITGPWKARFPWIRDQEYRFYEYACHEDNYTIRDFITASRAERAAASQ